MKVLIFLVLAVYSPLSFIRTERLSCPPAHLLLPCTCHYDIYNRTNIYCFNLQELNLEGIFVNASKFVGEDVVFNQLQICYVPTLDKIGDGAFGHFKFEEISIVGNPNLVHVSPRAFDIPGDWTSGLALFDNNISNAAPRERDIFDFVSSFKKLEMVNIRNNNLTSIPDHAFINHTSMRHVILSGNPISRIGSRAFAMDSNASFLLVSIDHNSLPSEGGLSRTTFDGARAGDQSIVFDISCNNMEYMEQESLQPLLDQVTYSGLYMGSDGPCHEGDIDLQRFACDGRVDWICEGEKEYRLKLDGYRCKNETGFGDIWEYCAGRDNVRSGTREHFKHGSPLSIYEIIINQLLVLITYMKSIFG